MNTDKDNANTNEDNDFQDRVNATGMNEYDSTLTGFLAIGIGVANLLEDSGDKENADKMRISIENARRLDRDSELFKDLQSKVGELMAMQLFPGHEDDCEGMETSVYEILAAADNIIAALSCGLANAAGVSSGNKEMVADLFALSASRHAGRIRNGGHSPLSAILGSLESVFGRDH